MQWSQYDCPKQFYEEISPFLGQKEAAYNLILGISLARAKAQYPDPSGKPPIMGVITTNGTNVLIVTNRSPLTLLLAGNGPHLAEAIEILVEELSRIDHPFHEVVGEPELATLFVQAWERKHQLTSEIKFNQRIYKLTQVRNIPHQSAGFIRRATIDDAAIVAEWTGLFVRYIHDKLPAEEAMKMTITSIEDGNMFIWDHNGPVSMAKKVRETENGAVIGLVYTPDSNRGNGYASACVAALSQLFLDEGYAFSCLYTDLANPTSNKIYQQVGYEVVEDSIVYRLK
ncbi:GNAT family N-acetyltransferase [Paenibacillus sp. KN14-4R]|uniref:GNAT family N-acetyltransferase n=1 Tax=Paenibacillus sp. KN14-4R TaxID=3445773 RepID=UPI003F9F15F7